MNRAIHPIAGLTIAMLIAVGAGLTAAAATPEPSASPASPSGTTGQCPMEEQGTGDPGTPGLGAVKTMPGQGRILMTVTGLVGPEGVFAMVVIDQSGLHPIDADLDWTINGATWETPDSVIFDSERAGPRHLFRLRLDDGAIEQITADPTLFEGDASAAPDGRIVHEQQSCATGLSLGLHVTSADGTQSTAITSPQLSTDDAWDEFPSVSPDGRAVVFVHEAGDGATGAIFVVPIDGGSMTRLTDDAHETGRPRWSPDGTTILFSRGGGLWTVPSSGGTATQILQSSTYRWEPDWSPDGTQILFKAYPGGDRVDVHTANPDGTNEHELWLGDHSSAEQPSWGK